MSNEFGLPQAQWRPAAVTIDLHRGHLDPAVGTMPLASDVAARVTAANVAFLGALRDRDVPVVHVITRYRDVEEIRTNPFWRAVADTDATRTNVLRHNLEHLPGVELMPGILDPEHDHIVGTKKRYDCFIATDLEFTLRSKGINLLLLTGVNTNSCVLATTIAASVRDFACVVIEDCVDTIDGRDLHDASLACIAQAFGWVRTAEQALKLLDRLLDDPHRPAADD